MKLKYVLPLTVLASSVSCLPSIASCGNEKTTFELIRLKDDAIIYWCEDCPFELNKTYTFVLNSIHEEELSSGYIWSFYVRSAVSEGYGQLIRDSVVIKLNDKILEENKDYHFYRHFDSKPTIDSDINVNAGDKFEIICSISKKMSEPTEQYVPIFLLEDPN